MKDSIKKEQNVSRIIKVNGSVRVELSGIVKKRKRFHWQIKPVYYAFSNIRAFFYKRF